MKLVTNNSNYCAMVVALSTFTDIPGRDRIKTAIIKNYKVIVGNDSKEGDIGLFFPVETALSPLFLASNNLHTTSELNGDPSKKGFFSEKGRVRCQRFGGAPSEGFFIPLNSLAAFTSEYNSLNVGDSFNSIDGIEVCKKYIIPTKNNGSTAKGESRKKAVKISRIVEDQFRFHNDTENLRYYSHKVNPNDLISISNKIHGSSFIVSNLLTTVSSWQQLLASKLPSVPKISKKKKLLAKLLTPIFNKYIDFGNYLLNKQSSKTQYDIIWASRRVIKNEGFCDNASNYYDCDIWGLVAEKIKDVIPKGITIYGEVFGFLPSGGAIQQVGGQAFDYCCAPKTWDFIVYRMTSTNVDSKVIELSWPQILEFAKTWGLKTPETYYYGLAKNYAPEIPTETHWHENFLNKLEADFMNDRDCPLCANTVPEEGIVVSIDALYNRLSLKLKQKRFLSKETEELDKGNIDMESIDDSVGGASNEAE